MEEIIRMQNNLLLIRRTVGWTAEEFGEKIGVTRQTINNIESGRNKLTKTQYIAMRSVLDGNGTGTGRHRNAQGFAGCSCRSSKEL